jgi:hypothetical protein
MKRRNFIKKSAAGTLAFSAVPAFDIFGNKSRSSGNGMFVGTPVLPEYLYEKGIAPTLDAMQELAGINTVMTFSHDHVFRQYAKNFEAKKDPEGNPLTSVWVKTDEKYYANPALMGRNPEEKYDGVDVLDDLWKEAEPRNMKVYARILEPYVVTGAIPGFENWREVDAMGNETNHVCFNHPGYIQYWESVIEDLIRSHPYLHGFKFGQERGGPLFSSFGKKQPGKCFCRYCTEKAKKEGLDPEEARKGLLEVNQYVTRIKSDELPVDGNFVTFMRLLMNYPEVLAWEKFWMDSREDQRKRIYKQIKSIRNSVQVGWHIDHGMTWDLITRASWDYAEMGPYSDWLSVAVYFDSMGRRSMGHYDKNYRQILFGDAEEDISYPMYLSMLGYDPDIEAPLEQHRKQDTSFTDDYVYRECRRAVKAVNGAAAVHSRPGFDMPGYDCNVQPEEVYKAVIKSLEAGVDGMWVGREWDELKTDNILAFGRAIKDFQNR